MVAELAAPARALLFEPDRPPDIEPNINSPARALGWSRSFVEYKRADWVRNHGDDAYGALVQEIVVRYVLHGVERARLAREYAISERQIQAYVTPKPTHRQPTARYYLQPVWRALGRLGLTPGRLTIEKRLGVAAHLSTLAADVLYLLDADQQSRERELCAALRLLATVWLWRTRRMPARAGRAREAARSAPNTAT